MGLEGLGCVGYVQQGVDGHRVLSRRPLARREGRDLRLLGELGKGLSQTTTFTSTGRSVKGEEGYSLLHRRTLRLGVEGWRDTRFDGYKEGGIGLERWEG